jgi:hypothetical protein
MGLLKILSRSLKLRARSEAAYRNKITNNPMALPHPAAIPRQKDAIGEKGSRLTIRSLAFGRGIGAVALNCWPICRLSPDIALLTNAERPNIQQTRKDEVIGLIVRT